MLNKIIEYAATAFGLGGALLVALLIREGFLVWIVGNTLWIVLGLRVKMYAMSFMCAVYEVICIFGYINWGQQQ